ncbi:MAG: FkbM family methyltransferase, partial [Methylococcaceae bacterium]
ADWVGSSGLVHAIEPDSDNFALLDANTQDFQKKACVHLHQLALGEAGGAAKLFRSKDNIGMHRLYDSVCCDGTSTEVPVCRGDELNLAPLDFIKIDIEGFELFALRGLSDTLNNSPDVKILCEFSPLSMMEAGIQPLEWLEWIEAHNFTAIAHNGKDWLPVKLAELKRDLNYLNKLDISALTSKLKTRDNASISHAAIEAAINCGYPRPILENLLLVRPQAIPLLIEAGTISILNIERHPYK